MELFLPISKDTENFGYMLAGLLKSGDIICFSGDLGAGKTLMSKGIAVGLGAAAEEVNSPTFAIMNIYQGTKMEIRHFDLYRLNRSEELDDIGFDEYCGGEGVTLIEWADLFPDNMPTEYLEIAIVHHENGRKVILTPHGKHYEEILEEVKNFDYFSN